MVKKLFSGFSALLISVASLAVFAPMIASAAVDACTWLGTSNSNFNTAANWSCATDGTAVPGAGDSLIFPYGTSVTNKALTNDLSANTSFTSITFSGAAAGGETAYSISGNSIQLTSGINNTSTNIYTAPQLKIDINVGGDLTANLSASISFGSSDETSKTLALGSHSLTVTGSGQIFQYDTLTGSGSITTAGPVDLYTDSPDFTGTITETDSDLILANSNQGGTIAVTGVTGLSIDICNNGTTTANLDVNNSTGISFNYRTCPTPTDGGGFGGGGGCDDTSFIPCSVTPDDYVNSNVLPTDGTITLAGSLNLGQDETITNYAKNLTITSTITGAHKLALTAGGNGSVVINSSDNGSQTANSTLTATRKVVTVDASDQSTAIEAVNGYVEYRVDGKRGDVYVDEGALIDGTGTVGALKVNTDSYVAPGHSPGCLNTGNLTELGTYQVQIGGTTPCSGYDQLKVTGSVNVNGGTPDVSFVDGFKGKAKDVYTIISNDGSDAVTGTFKGLAEGATFKSSDGYLMKVSYKGGDGNDVTLTVVSIPGAPNTGFGLILNNPAATLAGATLAAGALYIMSRRLKPATKKVRR